MAKFRHALELGRQSKDFRTFEYLVNQSNDALMQMSYDIKKAKNEHDKAFVTFFEGVHRECVENMEKMKGMMEKLK